MAEAPRAAAWRMSSPVPTEEGLPWVALVGRQQGEAGGGGHFDQRDVGVALKLRIGQAKQGAGGGRDLGEGDEADGCSYGCAAGAGDGDGFQRATGGAGEYGAKAFAAVGERAEVERPRRLEGA